MEMELTKQEIRELNKIRRKCLEREEENPESLAGINCKKIAPCPLHCVGCNREANGYPSAQRGFYVVQGNNGGKFGIQCPAIVGNRKATAIATWNLYVLGREKASKL